MQISLALLLIISCLNPAAAATTYITERLVPFDVPADDLRVVVQKQLSADDFLTNHFSNDHVEVTKLVYRATYNGTGRVVDPPYFAAYLVSSHSSTSLLMTPLMWLSRITQWSTPSSPPRKTTTAAPPSKYISTTPK